MTRGRTATLLPLIFTAATTMAAERYPGFGVVLEVDRAHKTVVVSHKDIPGFMDAMVMPFHVRDEKELEGLAVDGMIDFTLVVDQKRSYIENIRVHHYVSGETQPQNVARLKLIDALLSKEPTPAPLAAGDAVPDFTLVDQTGATVKLSDLAGRVLAVSFMYTRCRLPDYCLRLSNNLGELQKRFAAQLGTDVVLLTITFDPRNDTPDALAAYAKKWNADAAGWHFLTGPEADVLRVCHAFGMNAWPDMGMLNHTMRTLVIDREGKVAASLEGNEFTAKQLGDLVQSVRERQPSR